MTEARERILDATRLLCVEEGFGALTMRRVAARVGVTAPAIYRHFAGKSELIRGLLDEARERFMSYLVAALEGSTPRDRFDRASQRYLDFALEQPHAYELLFMTRNQFGLFGMPSSLEEWQGEPPATFQFAVDRVAECMQNGDLRDGDPNQVALAVSALAHGLVSLWHAGRFGSDERQFRAFYATAIASHVDGMVR